MRQAACCSWRGAGYGAVAKRPLLIDVLGSQIYAYRFPTTTLLFLLAHVPSCYMLSHGKCLLGSNIVARQMFTDSSKPSCTAVVHATYPLHLNIHAEMRDGIMVAKVSVPILTARIECLDITRLRRLTDYVLLKLRAMESWTCRCQRM